MALDLIWDGHSPIWDWGEVEDAHGWGKLHYEQLCRVQGTVTVGGQEIPFIGTGLRDHTRGPRDFTVVAAHIWSWANFPSGRGFVVLQVVVDQGALTRAITVEDGVIVPQTLQNSPVLSSRADATDPYVLDFGGHRMEAEILHLLPNGFEGPNDICLGYDPAVTRTANKAPQVADQRGLQHSRVAGDAGPSR